VDVPGCFGCKALSISYQGAPPSAQTVMESHWNLDMPAYHRLRMQGLQPKAIDGCAALERHASDQMEVEMGHLFKPGELASARAGMEIAKEIRETAAEAGISTLVRPPPT
jgi:hypothetical protein